ncbi:MAG: hypothetical protein IT573_01930 [Deltaproteobacteria bacterium]|nr:hypothetical protein [Deltaproteobacteria bacterium]
MKPVNKILLFNLCLSLGLGVLCFAALRALPKVLDLGVYLLVFDLGFIFLQILTCWVLSLVFFAKGDAGKGLGFLLSGIVVGVVGFGTCSALLMGNGI